MIISIYLSLIEIPCVRYIFCIQLPSGCERGSADTCRLHIPFANRVLCRRARYIGRVRCLTEVAA